MNIHRHKSAVLELTEAEFGAEVLRSQKPTMVTFFASWSRPCQIFLSTIEKVSRECGGLPRIATINADHYPELSLVYDIQSIPTLLYFVDGVVRAKLVGTANKEAILGKLNEVIRDHDAPSDPQFQTPDRT